MMDSHDEVHNLNAATATALAALIGVAVLNPPAYATMRDGSGVRSEMLVSTAWLQEHLSDNNLVVLYVGRDRSEYDAGHIPGARFLPLDELVEQHKDSLNDLPSVATLQTVFESLGVADDSRVILYGDGGGLLAARAYFTLDYLGKGDRVALLDGGFEKWKSESRAIDRQAVHPAQATFTPQVRNDVLITTAAVREITRTSVASNSLLLDARSPREFDGTVKSEAIPQAGHLPGARSLYWKTLLQSDTVPVLRETSELQQLFSRSGAEQDTLIITYCRTGMQSSFTYFVAKYLGYRAAMYDGSVYEWVNRDGYDLLISSPVPADATATSQTVK
jgi:thiosulfate/3-mercaptopyruvate sulfurtransferase